MKLWNRCSNKHTSSQNNGKGGRSPALESSPPGPTAKPHRQWCFLGLLLRDLPTSLSTHPSIHWIVIGCLPCSKTFTFILFNHDSHRLEQVPHEFVLSCTPTYIDLFINYTHHLTNVFIKHILNRHFKGRKENKDCKCNFTHQWCQILFELTKKQVTITLYINVFITEMLYIGCLIF